MKNKEILIYAPVDCDVFPLKELNDGVFSEGMLGVGLYVVPKKNIFTAPVEGSLIQIFDTKHALHFRDLDKNVLMMHIGIESVKLNGDGFNLLANTGQIVKTNTKVIDVDLKKFAENNILTATPIVIEEEKNFDYEVKILTKSAKQGDLIAKVIKSEVLKSEVKKSTLDEEGNLLPVVYSDKWHDASQWIMQAVANKENILSINKCNTRLRLNIKDLSKLKLDLLKNAKIIRGSVVNNNELQIIIGPDVQKLYDNFNVYVKNYDEFSDKKIPKRTREPLKSKIMNVINGILIPVVPVILAASLCTLIKALLEFGKAIDSVSLNYLATNGAINLLSDYDPFTGLVYILAQTAWAFVGVYFSYTTVKYLNGDPVIGILIGITLATPFLFSGLKWELFTMGNFTFSITAYASSIIPHIVAGVIYVYLDRWIQTWMPASISLIFRYSLGYIATVIAIMLILGPFLGLLEAGLYWVIIKGLGNIPYGIGAGIFGLIWQPIVLTGMHAAIYIPINIEIGNGNPMTLGLINSGTGALGQFGACCALIFVTRNSKLRQSAIASAPTALLGITEPAIYGCNLVKVTPFIAGCIGSGIGGFYLGITDSKFYSLAGNGILSIMGSISEAGGTANIVNVTIGYLISIVAAALFTLVLYKERISETQGIKKTYRLFSKIIKDNQLNEEWLQTDKKEVLNLYSKENRLLIKQLQNSLFKKGNLEQKIDKLTEKESEIKAKYSKKAIKSYESEKYEDVLKYNQLFDSVNIDKKIILTKIEELNLLIDVLMQKFSNIALEAKNITDKSINMLIELTDEKSYAQLRVNFEKGINSLLHNLDNKLLSNEKVFNYKQFKHQKAIEVK